MANPQESSPVPPVSLYRVIYREVKDNDPKITEMDIRVLASSVIEAAEIVNLSNRYTLDRWIIAVEEISHITQMAENRWDIVPREPANAPNREPVP